jgi:capsid protein
MPGDVYGTKLQLIEADRVSAIPNRRRTPTRSPAASRSTPTACRRLPHHQQASGGNCASPALTWTRIPRAPRGGFPVLHLFDRLRPELTRGVPYLAPVIEHLKQLGDYSDAEVTAAVVSAMSPVIETPPTRTITPMIGETRAPTLNDNEVKLGAGAVISLAGREGNLANPSRPNAKFDRSSGVLRQIGVALELPFELLIKHFTASYSASRAALEMAWQFFRKKRGALRWRFCQPSTAG